MPDANRLGRHQTPRISAWAMLIAGVAAFALLFPAPASASFGFLTKWGSPGPADGQFNSPRDVEVDPQGNVYVADTFNNRIEVFDPAGNFIRKWGSFGTGDGQFNAPTGIAIGSSGEVYVTDANNHRIQVFDASGNFVRKWGSFGTGDGQFRTPFDVATIPSDEAISSDEVFVLDTDNNRVQKFNASGSFVTKWGRFGSGGSQFNTPFDLAADNQNRLYVADAGNNQIKVFDSSGGFVTRWGSFGTGEGQFRSPRAVTTDAQRNVYVADTNNDRIQVFDASGSYLRQWGSSGSGDGQFNDAVGLATDSYGNVYVAETFPNDRIQVFGELPPTIADLMETVAGLELPQGIENSLEAKLEAAQTGNPCNQLAALINQIEALSGKKVPADAADELVADIQATSNSLSC